MIVSYYSFFLFKVLFPVGYILPNMFFCFAIVEQIVNRKDPPSIGQNVNLSSMEISAILIVQTIVFFILSVLLDKFRRGSLYSKKSPRKNKLVDHPPISANFRHKQKDISYEF